MSAEPTMSCPAAMAPDKLRADRTTTPPPSRPERP